jgi:hypothetical protein
MRQRTATAIVLAALGIALALIAGIHGRAEAYDPMPTTRGSCRLACDGVHSTWRTGSGRVASRVNCEFAGGCCDTGAGCAMGHCRDNNAAPLPPPDEDCR